jgi:hypothetical protein
MYLHQVTHHVSLFMITYHTPEAVIVSAGAHPQPTAPPAARLGVGGKACADPHEATNAET